MPKPIIHDVTPVEAPQIQAGGRGPTPPQAPGGPDRDDWDRWPQGSRGPREKLRRYRLLVAAILVAIFFFFIAITSAYVIRQNTTVLDTRTNEMVNNWRPIHLPPVLWINTILLLVSSLTIELARRQMFREPQATQEWLGMGSPTRSRSLPWLGITLILGLGFLAGQVIAWRELNAQGVYLAANPSGAFFFILTGAHALHLIGGVCALLWAATVSVRRTRLEQRQIVVDVSAWYWHGMGALWAYIFAVLYWVR